MNGKAWDSAGQVTSSSHWCGQSGWEMAAPGHTVLALPLLVPLTTAKALRVLRGG